jgi:hypothetical protein
MQSLQDDGLGKRKVVSAKRDKFILDVDHAAADRLSSRPDANGFIRADLRTLLFRGASDALRQLLTQPHDMSIPSTKGVEFRWNDIDAAAIRRLFAHVAQLARN